MNIPIDDEVPRRFIRLILTILAVCLAFYGLYFAFKAIRHSFTQWDEKRAVNIVTSRDLIPTPKPEIQTKDVPVIDPAIQEEIQQLKEEVQSLK